MAYYLTYRPQKIGDLDNENVRNILFSVLSQPNIPHAFLFTGPKGLGKTSSARIVAKSINCVGRQLTVNNLQLTKKESKKSSSELTVKGQLSNVPTVEPCNECEMCVSITNGSNMDILEIDAASNRGIDEIRDLREKIRLAPVRAKRKVYIIDEVHMLTTEAFNALLKTLEEPPPHAVFVLATTEPHKVPETIISRCLHIPFHRATSEELVRSLTRIVESEGITIEKKLLEDIAELADGGFRDGAKILEELVSFSRDKKIDNVLFEKRFHTRSVESAALRILTAFGQKDTKGGFEIIAHITKEGADFSYLLDKLLTSLHTILLLKIGVKEDDRFENIAPLFSLSELSHLFSILSKALTEMKYTIIPELPLELALVEYVETPFLETANEESATAQSEKKLTRQDKSVTVTSLRKKVGTLAKKQLLEPELEEKPKTKEKETNGNLLAYKAEGDLTDEWISDFWQGIIHKMKEYNHTLAGVMRGCNVRSFDRKTLIIETKFTFHKERLSEEKTLHVLEEICQSLTGNKIGVLVELVK